MVDRILAVLSILTVVAYFVPLLIEVPEPGLFIVLCAVVVMVAYDFVRELRRPE